MIDRMPYKLICICPNAGQAAFKSKAEQFIKRSNIFPQFIEGLAPNSNAPQTHLLISFQASQAVVDNYVTGILGVANTFWWAVDIQSSTMAYKSSSAEVPATGDHWDVNLALDYRNLQRKYNAKI